MSWIANTPITWFQKFCINVLKCGRVPRHIAFIMDGNRRYAQKTHVERKHGHIRGFDKLAETLQWCFELGIREVTVYAFSTENFNRSHEEVDTLMDLAREKYKRLMEEKEKLMSEGVCIRVIGKLDLIPADIRKSITDAVLMTKDNNKLFLNVAFAYTSREEIIHSIQTVTDGVRSGSLEIDDIEEELLSHCLYTNSSYHPDVLIRTSGETRLSDFLLWQIGDARIFFTNVLWPEFCIWHLLGVVFKYQTAYSKAQATHVFSCSAEHLSKRKQGFVKDLEITKFAILEQYAHS